MVYVLQRLRVEPISSATKTQPPKEEAATQSRKNRVLSRLTQVHPPFHIYCTVSDNLHSRQGLLSMAQIASISIGIHRSKDDCKLIIQIIKVIMNAA